MARPATDVTGPTLAGPHMAAPGLRRLASPAVRAAIARRANELGGTLLGFAAPAHATSLAEIERKLLDATERLMADGATAFVEVGPGKVLAGLIRKIDRSVTVVSVADEGGLAALDSLPR